jgi:hypothetical protein
MRYLVGFVLALTLVASPLGARAQEDQAAPPSWLESELATVMSGQRRGAVKPVDRLQIALIPEHLKQRQPGYRKTKPSEAKPSEPTSEGQSKGLSRGGKIAIGVLVPLVVGTAIGVGVWAATFEL